ncbi:MAG: DNA ligase (ATP) [Ramalina farinacea]|uniref:DNA ligase n=1 Tax=Ramalina farinacea TaxID=258253 RepID=A0AA43QRA7_9LECA|nr:DNA ligase (ATP) [Ramalina farinacea]
MEDAGEKEGLLIQEDLDEKYPDRPRNHSKTLPFHELYQNLFDPLNNNKKKPTGPVVPRRRVGPNGPSSRNPHEIRQNIVERFISRWRTEVGDDIHPAFRLILPEKDRERPMYGLKESIIAKLLIQAMKIHKDSEDATSLRNWKLPGQTTASRMAGDFAGRCYEVISKRPVLSSPGTMTIGEVNDLLDKLAATGKQEDQAKIFSEFYRRMNPEELKWLIRIILRQMKIGASEKTIFEIWHPDAASLFNICSNLRRVCWELPDPKIRLGGEDRGVTLMSCFQPQLAQFQMHSFEKMVARMQPTEDDPTFWIEEKLDGERMQLHMIEDEETPGGKRFGFWSRKAKDYCYLYGHGFEDDNSALTRHLRDAFDDGVDNIILDGEMITWDMGEDLMVPFGTLKTAAKEQQANPFSRGWRPLFRVFDILYLNGTVLTNYTLRDRRSALERAVKSVTRRLEIHTYVEAKSVSEIDPLLRKVVQEASEGLVLKNPRSAYKLNDRNDDWMKVKPEYMNEFGENLDLVIIGGYYGSGHRGGKLSSFMCGLRVDENHVAAGADPMQFHSFMKVGGGFTSSDYAAIRHKTDGKWKKFDPKKPPLKYMVLACGGGRFYEQPDEWILPSDSVVVEVKAASIATTDLFKTGFTLRFPRFKRLREDRNWENALSLSGFQKLRMEAETERKTKAFQVDDSRRKRQRTSKKKPLKIAGSETVADNLFEPSEARIFNGLDFYVMTGSPKPNKKSKSELEQMIKAHGGNIVQHARKADTVCIADHKSVSVASAMKRKESDLIRPSWLFDNIKQSEIDAGRPNFLLPFEPKHAFDTKENSGTDPESNVDMYGDSYARDTTIEELRSILNEMPTKFEHKFNSSEFRRELEDHGHGLEELPGWLFEGLLLYLDDRNGGMIMIQNIARFAGAKMSDKLEEGVTHIVIGEDQSRLRELRGKMSHFSGSLPRVVSTEWVKQSWEEKTLLDEEST